MRHLPPFRAGFGALIPALALLAGLASCGGDPEQKSGGSQAADTGIGSGATDVNLFGKDSAGGTSADTGSTSGDTGAAAADSTAGGAGDTATTGKDDTATSAPDTAALDSAAADSAATDSGSAPDTGTAGPPDTGTADSGAPDAGTADSGAGGSDATTTDTSKPAEPVVRFAAFGDTGTASEKQYKVGKVLAEHCKKKGCDFVLMLGDNFYDVGVDDENDKLFQTMFEKPYKDVKAPFFVVLGNHDYGAGGAGAEFMKSEHYIKYGKKNPKWVMPKAYWDKKFKHVHLFGLDSNSMMYGDVLKFIVADQLKEMDALISKSTAEWKISFAHHPVRSNGPHGNAGCYEGAKAAPIPQLCGIIPVASGKGVLEAYNKLVCGRMDMHFAGHDHSRQWLKQSASTKHCKGVELIVAGGGAKTSDLETKSKGGFEFNPVHWQDATTPGFFYAEIKGKTLTGSFIDMNGKVNFTRTYTKK